MRSLSHSAARGVFIVLAGICLPSALLGATRIEVAATPKKEAGEGRRQGNVSKEVTEVQYTVKLTNRSFADVKGLRAEYHIFVRGDSGRGSSSDQKVRRQSGQVPLPDLINNGTHSFDTEPVKLVSTQLDGGWYYQDGKRNKSAEKVVGVWIRILEGDKVVGEYINPTSLATREKF